MAGSEATAARRIIRRRRPILAAWIVVCLALVPAARSIESVLSVAARIDGSESATVDNQLAQRFRSPFAHSVVLVATGLPSPTSATGERALGALVAALKSAPGVTGVISYLDGREPLMAADSGVDATFMVVGLEGSRPDARLESLREATRRLERAMRSDYPRIALRWTGETALNADLRIKAIALNLLAVAAAFGAVKLVFQDGVGASALGLAGPLDAIFPAVPVLVFCIVFGLSMDYEVFLVARIREARVAGLGEREAIADGLSRTGGLITSAAAIMVAVFGAFVLGDFLLIKMLGFALAVTVLLDATVMRLAVSPALLTLAAGGTGGRETIG
jgi:uncharacterized membrane protein YdfJ with MMPL/SSD domain